MESENESRPLLHSFQSETWRSRLRKRCLRIPSEITITGIILGLFLLVVTLLIVLENIETKKENELTLDENLLASPFKYNKKALDQSWQDKKENMKQQNKNKDQKWDKVNKGWKILSSEPGIKRVDKEGVFENWKENVEITDLPDDDNEYGKEVDYTLEKSLKEEQYSAYDINQHETKLVNLLKSSMTKEKKIDGGWNKLSEQEQSDLYSTQDTNQYGTELMNLLKDSRIKWKKVDDGWNKLTEQGWKDKDIRKSLFDAIKEKEALEEKAILQSAMNFDQLWKKINESLEKNHQKGKKEKEKQKGINDDWKNKMNILQSPKVSGNDVKNVDDGLKKLSDQGWKSPEIKDALSKALKEEFIKFKNILQSPIELEKIWGNITATWSKNLEKGNKKKKDQKNINDEWKNKIYPLESPNASENKWEEEEDWTISEEEENSLHGKKSSSRKPAKSLQSSMSFDDFNWKKVDDGWKKLSDQGWKDKEIKEALYKAWKDDNKLEQMAVGSSSMKWKKVNDGWKKISNKSWKDKEIKEALYKAWKDDNKLEQMAVGSSSMKWKKVNDGWKKISNKSVGVPTRCPISKSQLLLGSAMSAPQLNCALIAEQVRREFGSCIDMSFLPKACKPSWRTKCFSSYKYRKIDGTCNNQIHPTWGKSGTPFVRMISPDYADGVSALRTAKNGGELPNPRFLSRTLYSKRMKPDTNNSVLFLYFGLLVDHDMVETGVNSGTIPCCEDHFLINPLDRPKECIQIDVPDDDPFYGPRNVKCLNLVRSFPVNGECAGRREQLNKATSFLDGSAVYGSVIPQAKKLRTYNKGQLRTQYINSTPFMANVEGAGYSCGTPNEPLKCFEAGDSRVNMMVELTAMHTLWYREHNRIATELHELNPQWRDEIVFQEAKRIVTGELQRLTYSEFLPLLLGESAMKQYELNIDDSKEYTGYDETVDPSVFNVFGTAAFRFGHSLAPDVQYLLGADNSTLGQVALHETFFNANLLYHNGLDLLLRGAASQRTQSVDSYITPEVREHLFQPADLDYGHDLAAVGIQRGRDHGLPPFVKWRSVCGLSKVESWEDLHKIMDKERADMLQNVYQSVEDIDLIPGALAEYHETGSLLGPTYICLIGRQFKKTRKGDRFWFEIQNEETSFTRGQLDQIYKSNMARIICDNSDNIEKIQRDPFKVPSDQNPILDCSAIPKVDLSEWRLDN